MVTKPKVLRRAMRYLLVRTVGTVQYVNVKQVIIAPVKPQTKRLVFLGPTQPAQNQFRVLNVHLARMPILLVPQLATSVATMHTNRNPMLRNAFQCKKGSTNRAPQPKSNVRRVNPVPGATQRAKIAWKEHSKPLQVKPPATTAPADGEIPATARPAATPYHRVRTH